MSTENRHTLPPTQRAGVSHQHENYSQCMRNTSLQVHMETRNRLRKELTRSDHVIDQEILLICVAPLAPEQLELQTKRIACAEKIVA
ncbi:MAG: hypothetical protein AB1704_02945 [Pseudomonadota bacterium]|jgi:hypothetical protein|uniref:hypothetical protein n=1 Tax=Burkholderiaceae TaxID=119060 RepID=UPI0010F6B3C4|nr:hypothetical protein [Burkholderia sp. 4M9327F10]